MAKSSFAIGALSKRTGVNIETIRYYEKTGVLQPAPRTEGGYRTYSSDDVRRLAFIRRARELGFSLDEVRALLDMAQERKRSCAEVRDVATQHLRNVRAKLADLRVIERVLKKVTTQCTGALLDCSFTAAVWRCRESTPSPRELPSSNRSARR